MAQNTTKSPRQYLLDLKNSPYLKGVFKPVEKEISESDVKVIGEIPSDIKGSFVCNSANPAFQPKGYYIWFDGDGMVHGTHIENGKARYYNRFIKTKYLQQELEAKENIWPGLLSSIQPDAEYAGVKDTANTIVIHYNKALLALWYLSGKPYELDPETLDTKGVYDFNKVYQGNMMAHVKIDQHTNQLCFYDFNMYKPPYFTYGCITGGETCNTIPIDIPYPSYFHDMGMTVNYGIIIDLPLVWEKEQMKDNKRFLGFHKHRTSRFGLVDKNAKKSGVRWFDAEPCYMYHIENAYEEDNKVIIVGCRIANPVPSIDEPIEAPRVGSLHFCGRRHKWELNLDTGATLETQMEEMITEFPAINPMYAGRKHRYSYHCRYSDDMSVILLKGLIKYDMLSDKKQELTMPDGYYCNEPVFVARDSAQEEDDGYLLTYISKAEQSNGELWILDAKNITQEPLAKLQLLQRVPPLFHGTWVQKS